MDGGARLSPLRGRRLSIIIKREDNGFAALCPELDIVSQGTSIEEEKANLIEAISLFCETALPSEISRRFENEMFVTRPGKNRANRTDRSRL